MSKTIMLGSMNGHVYLYDIASRQLQSYSKFDNSGVMGLQIEGGYLFAASRKKIRRYPYKQIDGQKIGVTFSSVRSPEFHQLLVHEQRIYITCTAINEVWVLDLDLNILSKHKIKPPRPNAPVELKKNYNHLNSICYHNGVFYVGLNWFTSTQYGMSGVCMLDDQLNEIHRLQYGWETHGFTFVDNKPYALCATSGTDKNVHHPRHAGLMVDEELVFEHPTDVFCKAFAVDEDCIYLVGGDVATRDKRGTSGGVIYMLDRDFRLLDTIKFDNTGQLCGVISV